jgi:hypothetical protein
MMSVEAAEDKAFDQQFDAALATVNLFVRQWEKWSGELSRVNLWNKTMAAEFIKEKAIVFPEVSYSENPTNGQLALKITPPYLQDAFGMDLTNRAKEGGPGLEPFPLDLPLNYPPGTSAEAAAALEREIVESLPDALTQFSYTLLFPAEQGLTEELMEWELRRHYFTPAAAATPKGAMLIRGLARYCLMRFLKAAGKMDGDAEATTIARLFYFDLPEGAAARSEFLRDFETLDPFSDAAQERVGASPLLAAAGGRFAAFVLGTYVQRVEAAGAGPLQFLRERDRVPKGGFASVADFGQALEAAYGTKLEQDLREGRAEFTGSIRKRSAPPAAAAPAPELAAELPDRQTQVVAGITVTSPASLAKAVAKLAPEWAALLAQARQRLDERFAKGPAPAVPITDDTLTMLRGQGLAVTREKADVFASEAAVLANAGHMLKGMYQGKAVQVWFKSELKALLLEGHAVPGFSYDAKEDIVKFAFGGQAHLTVTINKDKPLGEQSVVQDFSKFPPPVYPIVLKDDTIAELTEVDAQAAKIREGDTFMGPLMRAAGTVSPAQLGIKESPWFGGSLLTPAQSLFVSMHDLVADELAAHVVASPDRRWFAEGLANLLALRACQAQFGKDEPAVASKTFAALYDPTNLSRRAAEVDLLAWALEEGDPAQGSKDEDLNHAHQYYATRALIVATEGRADDFLKTWIAKIRETPWNRTNAGTIIAAYDQLTGKSLREILKTTVAAPSSR